VKKTSKRRGKKLDRQRRGEIEVEHLPCVTDEKKMSSTPVCAFLLTYLLIIQIQSSVVVMSQQ
jgi:hypothetical protein